MFNVQTLVKTGDRPDVPAKCFLLQYLAINKFICAEFFVLTTGKYIQSVILTAKEFSETASCAFAQTVLNCQQQHENTSYD